MKLKELEKRLKLEPDNLGLRVTVAGLMREAGRSVEAVELYRSVALAYRDQGRSQQAIAVCRSILEIAPEDAACQGLLATLSAPARTSAERAAVRPSGELPVRRSSLDETPLPRPIPHHVADPTSQQYRLSAGSLDLPTAEGADTRPGNEDAASPPANSGLAEAARRISGLITDSHGVVSSEMDLSAELDTRQRPKITTDQLAKLDEVTSPMGRETPMPERRDSSAPRLTPIPIPRDSDSDLLTEPREALPPRISEEELTTPHGRSKLFDDE